MTFGMCWPEMPFECAVELCRLEQTAQLKHPAFASGSLRPVTGCRESVGFWDVQGLKVARSIQVCNSLRDQCRRTGPMAGCRFLSPACRIEACGRTVPWCPSPQSLANPHQLPRGANPPHSVTPFLVAVPSWGWEVPAQVEPGLLSSRYSLAA